MAKATLTWTNAEICLTLNEVEAKALSELLHREEGLPKNGLERGLVHGWGFYKNIREQLDSAIADIAREPE